MKFVSKANRLNVVISPGLSAQPLTGTPEKPRISAQFEGGILEVKDEGMIEKLLAHPGFNRDFYLAEVGQVDPYAYSRSEIEPAHQITEIQFGHPTARKTGAPKQQLSPEVRKLLQEEAASMAKDMVKQMLPEAVQATLEALAKDVKAGQDKPEDVTVATVEAPEGPTEPVAVKTKGKK